MSKKRLEGPFHTSPATKCNSCGEIIRDKEYRRNYDEKLYRETGGKEGRIAFCIPCGEKIIVAERKETNEEYKRNQEKRIKNAREIIKDSNAIINSLTQRLAQENVAGSVEDYKKIKDIQKKIKSLGSGIMGSSTNQECPIIKGDIEKLKNSCQDLINEYISPKDRKIGDKGRRAIHSPCCTPKNVKLEENNTESYYYCDYC